MRMSRVPALKLRLRLISNRGKGSNQSAPVQLVGMSEVIHLDEKRPNQNHSHRSG